MSGNLCAIWAQLGLIFWIDSWVAQMADLAWSLSDDQARICTFGHHTVCTKWRNDYQIQSLIPHLCQALTPLYLWANVSAIFIPAPYHLAQLSVENKSRWRPGTKVEGPHLLSITTLSALILLSFTFQLQSWELILQFELWCRTSPMKLAWGKCPCSALTAPIWSQHQSPPSLLSKSSAGGIFIEINKCLS